MRKPFTPTTVTLKEIHDAVPKHLLKSQSLGPMEFLLLTVHLGNTLTSALYVLRDIVFSIFLFKFASMITPWAQGNFGGVVTSEWMKVVVKSLLWLTYWWFQGLVWAGMFVLGEFGSCDTSHISCTHLALSGHDAGHGTLFDSNKMNDAVGFAFHTVRIATPSRISCFS